ncbi:hypothetical protein EC973_008830 [Apophysomyces ossiformis]|uniref:Ras-GEF domain-containing protein n=1 Tax=Apophysomyces ossiformis TaxID=679940 RepID=A0A8H7C0H4_9FUNG|nr:hypothetical protein EC973_008830 [Apophysomyces ossiformis]
MATAAGSLPLIPLSPIAKQVVALGNTLAQATENLTEAKQANPPVSLFTLRRLNEDVRIERNRIDKLTGQMHSVQSATAFHWDPDVLARQIAMVDCQLYANVVLQKRWLCQQDKKQTKLVHLLDFHRYLTHSFAHQLIYWAELTKGRPPIEKVIPLVHPKDNLVSHLVRVAYLLLHAYRDFSGLSAIMKALMLPEVRRLRRLWQLPSRIREMYRELTAIVSSANSYAGYHEALRNKVSLFARTATDPRHGSVESTIAIPWIQPHLAAIQSIITAYTAGDHDEINPTTAENLDVLLSAPGARKLAVAISILELCQRNSTTESIDLLEDELNLTDSSIRRASMMKPLHIDGLRSSIVPIPDLNRLAPGDLLAHHWLVSRVYLRKDQLVEESIEVEPLMPNERLSADDDDEQEEDKLMAEETPTLVDMPIRESVISRRASISSTRAIKEPAKENTSDVVIAEPEAAPTEQENSDDDGSDDNNDSDNNNDGNEPNVVAPTPVDETKPMESTPAASNDAADQPLDSQPETVSDAAGVNDAGETKQDSQEHVIEQDLQGVWSKVNQHKMKNEAVEQSKSVAAQSNAAGSVSTQQNSTISEQVKKSRLSPTAPEFIPLNRSLSLSAPVPSGLPSSIIVSPASSVNDIQDLEPVPDGEEENEDEIWRGYPNKSSDDSDSEEWNGYPSPTSDETMADEEEDEEEIWKGYPMPADATDPNVRRGSSQSEGSEGWKGYHAGKMEAAWQMETELQVQQHDWQGYTLETSNEDELDSSTMLDGKFGRSRQARDQRAEDAIEIFRQQAASKTNVINKTAAQKLQNTNQAVNRPVSRFKP